MTSVRHENRKEESIGSNRVKPGVIVPKSPQKKASCVSVSLRNKLPTACMYVSGRREEEPDLRGFHPIECDDVGAWVSHGVSPHPVLETRNGA